jgi:type I restriction enzyme M protein
MARNKTVYSTAAESKRNGNGTANLGFEQKLWLAADKLRGNMDASEYKHVILGLIFLKYISDSFESRRLWLLKESADSKSEYFVKNEAQRAKVTEDRDEYLSENVFWGRPKARWMELQKNAHQPPPPANW